MVMKTLVLAAAIVAALSVPAWAAPKPDLWERWEAHNPAGREFRLAVIGEAWTSTFLANDGNNVDRFGDMKFGDDGPGDIYERIMFGTRPFKALGGAAENIVIAIGGDIVFRDENAQLLKDVDGDGRLEKGDLAGQAIIVFRYQPVSTPWNWIGGYAVYRDAVNADAGTRPERLLLVGLLLADRGLPAGRPRLLRARPAVQRWLGLRLRARHPPG